MPSKLFSLNLFDFFKGVVTAVFSALIAFFYSFLKNGGDLTQVDFKQVGSVALVALLGYLMKQLSTDSDGSVLGVGGK